MCPADRSALCCCCSCCCCAAASDLRSCLHLSTPIITRGHDRNRRLKKTTSLDQSTLRSDSRRTSRRTSRRPVIPRYSTLTSLRFRSGIVGVENSDPVRVSRLRTIRGFTFRLPEGQVPALRRLRVLIRFPTEVRREVRRQLYLTGDISTLTSRAWNSNFGLRCVLTLLDKVTKKSASNRTHSTPIRSGAFFRT